MKITMTNLGVWCALIAACNAAVAQAEVSADPPVPSVESATDAALAPPSEVSHDVMGSAAPAAPEMATPLATTPNAADVFAPEEPVNPALARGYLSPNNEWNTSVMFVPSQMRKLRQVVEVFEENREFFTASKGGDDAIDDILKWDTGIGSKTASGVANSLPTFFLASIVYYKPDDWSVWLGGRKISSKDNSENAELYIASVTKSEVQAVWRPSAMDRVLAMWTQEAIADYSQETGAIQLNRKDGIIRFKIKPNQTFNSGLAQVVEGKSAPVAMLSKTAGKKAAGHNSKETGGTQESHLIGDDSIRRMVESPTAIKDPEQISQELMQQYKNIGKIVPKRN